MKHSVIFAIFVAFFFSFEVFGADYYVRPFNECPAFNGNGTSPVCATSNGGVGAWRGFTGFSQSIPLTGDVVRLCTNNEFGVDSADNATVMLVVNMTNPSVVITGNCSASGYSARAKVNGGGTHDRGFDSGGSGATGIILRDIEITGFDLYGVLSQGLNSVARNWELTRLYIHDNRGAVTQGVDLRGTGHTLTDVVVENSGQDNVYFEGDNFTWNGGKSLTPSLDSAGGDGLQCSTECDNFRVVNVTMTSGVDIKQCFIAQDNPGTLSGSILGGSCEGPSGKAINHTAYFMDGTGAVLIEGVYVKNSRMLAYGANGAALTVRSSIGHDFSEAGVLCGTASGDCTIENVTISRVSGNGISVASAGLATTRNNVIRSAINGVVDGLGDSESYNAISDVSGSPCVRNGSPVSCGTGNVAAPPLFSGGDNPTTAEGFRPSERSPLARAGLFVGRNRDFSRRPFAVKPSIGAFEVLRSGQSIRR